MKSKLCSLEGESITQDSLEGLGRGGFIVELHKYLTDALEVASHLVPVLNQCKDKICDQGSGVSWKHLLKTESCSVEGSKRLWSLQASISSGLRL